MQTFGSAENWAGNLRQRLVFIVVSIPNIGLADGGGSWVGVCAKNKGVGVGEVGDRGYHHRAVIDRRRS